VDFWALERLAMVCAAVAMVIPPNSRFTIYDSLLAAPHGQPWINGTKTMSQRQQQSQQNGSILLFPKPLSRKD
jgi:hypothetical protein